MLSGAKQLFEPGKMIRSDQQGNHLGVAPFSRALHKSCLTSIGMSSSDPGWTYSYVPCLSKLTSLLGNVPRLKS